MIENVNCINCKWYGFVEVEQSSDINDIKCPHCGLKELYLGEPIRQSLQS